MQDRHKIILAIFDLWVLVIAFYLGFWLVFPSGWIYSPRPFPDYFTPSATLVVVIFLIIFQIYGLYKYQAIINASHQIRLILKSYFQVMAAFITIVFFLKTQYIADSRLTIGSSLMIAILLNLSLRVIIIPKIYKKLVNKGLFRKRIFIYGAGEHGNEVLAILRANPIQYFEVIGFIDDNQEKINTDSHGIKVLGNSYDLESLVKRHGVQEIIIAISNIRHGKLQDLIFRCKEVSLTIHVVSELYSTVTEKIEAEEFGGLRTYRIIHQQNGIIRSSLKRMVDLLGSTGLLIFIAPFFLIIAWLIKRDSPGPVFYRREVVGKGGKTFVMFKFRTMEVNNDPAKHLKFMKAFIQGETQETYLKEEPRITKIGRLLRKYSLDELPQLWNVLKGDMSLVGPRFCSSVEYQFYKPWHKQRTKVKPGLTGLWQVRARSEVKYDDMVVLDLYYIDNMSLWLDLEILLRTISVVFSGKGSRIN